MDTSCDKPLRNQKVTSIYCKYRDRGRHCSTLQSLFDKIENSKSLLIC